MSSTSNTSQENRKRVLTLEIEGGGRTFDFSGEKLNILPVEEPEIKLHFLRFGAFQHAPKNNHLSARIAPENEEKQGTSDDNPIALEEVILQDPELDQFAYTRTGLNQGFLYILDEKDPTVPIEYEIGANGNFQSVSWEDPTAEIREKDGKLNSQGYHLAEFEAVLWAGYSSVAWSKAFYDSLVNNVTERKKFMTKVICTGFLEGENTVQGDIISNTSITTHFTADRIWQHRDQQAKLNYIEGNEIIAKKEHEEKQLKTPFIRTDMYVTLNDPVGCALEVGTVLADKIIAFKGTTNAIHSGDTIENEIQKLQDSSFDTVEPNAEYGSLISLAMTCYSMVYNDESAITKYDGGTSGWHLTDNQWPSAPPRDDIKIPEFPSVYSNPRASDARMSEINRKFKQKNRERSFLGAGLDSVKLEGILGLKIRTEKREELQKARKDLCIFLQSKYLKQALEPYLNNLPELIVEGRSLFLDLFQNLFIHPYEIDRHLLLHKQYVKNDDIRNWINNLMNDEISYVLEPSEGAVISQSPLFSGSDSLYALLTLPVSVSEVFAKNMVSFSNSLAGVIKAKLTFHSDQIFKVRLINGRAYRSIREKHKFVVSRLNANLKVFGEEMFELSNNQIRLRLADLAGNASLDYERVQQGRYTGSNTDVLRILKRSDGVVLIQTTRGSHTIEIPIERSGDQLSPRQINANNTNQKLGQIVNSRAFKGTIAFLQILNLKAAFFDLLKKPDAKHLINFVGASAEVIESTTVLLKGFISSNRVLYSTRMTKIVQRAGVLGAVIGSGMSFWDATKALDRRDKDAALAYAGAGIAFGVSAWVTFAVVAGPIGWIAAAIGLGFCYSSEYFNGQQSRDLF